MQGAEQAVSAYQKYTTPLTQAQKAEKAQVKTKKDEAKKAKKDEAKAKKGRNQKSRSRSQSTAAAKKLNEQETNYINEQWLQ